MMVVGMNVIIYYYNRLSATFTVVRERKAYNYIMLLG